MADLFDFKPYAPHKPPTSLAREAEPKILDRTFELVRQTRPCLTDDGIVTMLNYRKKYGQRLFSSVTHEVIFNCHKQAYNEVTGGDYDRDVCSKES